MNPARNLRVIGDEGAIPGDVNTNLEVVVFDDYTQYALYAWAIYNIDVDNGGMYEEGNPAAAGNQARFIAHEAHWLRPDFQIWNLNHEYTHYLDGRYNMAGDFEAGMTTPTIWWVEGIAENISFGYRGERNADAIGEAGKQTYKLSDLFDTVYNQDGDPESTRTGSTAGASSRSATCSRRTPRTSRPYSASTAPVTGPVPAPS